jgi:hypothetical protein
MSALKIAAVAFLLLGLQSAAAGAEDLPKLDVNTTCNGAAEFGREKKGCLDDELSAKRILGQTWSKFNADHKTQCVGSVQAGGPGSYVELLSCLEAMRDAKDFHEDGSIAPSDQPVPPHGK